MFIQAARITGRELSQRGTSPALISKLSREADNEETVCTCPLRRAAKPLIHGLNPQGPQPPRHRGVGKIQRSCQIRIDLRRHHVLHCHLPTTTHCLACRPFSSILHQPSLNELHTVHGSAVLPSNLEVMLHFPVSAAFESPTRSEPERDTQHGAALKEDIFG